jgi:hypothetical protein
VSGFGELIWIIASPTESRLRESAMEVLPMKNPDEASMSSELFNICEMSVLLFAIMFGLTSIGLVAHVMRENPYFRSSIAHLSGMLM